MQKRVQAAVPVHENGANMQGSMYNPKHADRYAVLLCACSGTPFGAVRSLDCIS
jgi:hypothetical protein